MNVSQYSPSRELERQAIGSIDALPSVKEALRGGPAADAGTAAPPAIVRSGTWEDDDAEYRYSVDDRGRCVIDRCAAKVARLRVPAHVDGAPVAVIGGHSFSTCYELTGIELPPTVEEIREHAFMNTALERFGAPPALRTVGTKAFYRCERLRQVQLNDGLLVIGEGTFRESALTQLQVPGSVTFIGRDAFKGTELVFAGAGQTLLIADGNSTYGLHGGALYRADDDGLELVQALDDDLVEYRGVAGLAHVGERAFAGLRQLREVALPEGVLDVGDAAFKGCIALVRVELPDTVRAIGRQAFRQTSLEQLRIPRDLGSVGSGAFYTGGSVARDFRQTIRSVQVAPGNDVFYIEEETLCCRTADGGAMALLHFGTQPNIVVPRSATSIGPYAFLNSRHATQVTMHDRIVSIDVGGLDFGRALSRVVCETSGDAAERYVIEYPPGDANNQMARITFGGGNFDVVFAYAECDHAILHAGELFTRARMMLDRLRNPVHLQLRMETLFRSRLKTAVPLICVEFGRNGYVEGVDYLLDLGFLDEGNVQEAIDAAIEAGEVAIVSRLVEMKRTRFDLPLFDWDL